MGKHLQMQMQNADLHQLPAHVRDQSFADFSHLGVVVLDRFKSLGPILGDVDLGPLGATQESSVCGDGHDAGNNRDIDTLGADLVHPLDEEVGVVEHLCHDEAATSVHLLLQMVDELVDVVVVVGTLGVPGHTNVEVVAVLLADIFDQVLRISEAALDSLPLLGLAGRVAAKGKDIGAAGVVGGLEGVVDLGGLHVGAGQVHACLEAVHALCDLDHLAGQVGETATSAPGDVDELGSQAVHAVHAVVEILNTLLAISAGSRAGHSAKRLPERFSAGRTRRRRWAFPPPWTERASWRCACWRLCLRLYTTRGECFSAGLGSVQGRQRDEGARSARQCDGLSVGVF